MRLLLLLSPGLLVAGQLVPPQVQELLSAPVTLPNPYLEMSIQGFTDALDMYR